jgi:hypothetical protein
MPLVHRKRKAKRPVVHRHRPTTHVQAVESSWKVSILGGGSQEEMWSIDGDVGTENCRLPDGESVPLLDDPSPSGGAYVTCADELVKE